MPFGVPTHHLGGQNMSNPRVHVAALSPTTQTPPPRPTTHPPTYATAVNPAWMPLNWDANPKHLWSAGILRASVGGGGLLGVHTRNGQRPQHTWCNKCARVTRVWARQRRLAKSPIKIRPCAFSGILTHRNLGGSARAGRFRCTWRLSSRDFDKNAR